EPALEQADQVLAGVALAPRRFLIDAAELALADIAVVALEPLLGHQLLAIVGWLLAPLAMLARAVIALVDRALRPAPQIDAQPAVDLVLGFQALGHLQFPRWCPDSSGAQDGQTGPAPRGADPLSRE